MLASGAACATSVVPATQHQPRPVQEELDVGTPVMKCNCRTRWVGTLSVNSRAKVGQLQGVFLIIKNHSLQIKDLVV